ncbi:MAG: Nramp family divalent metal transporter [Flavobacteriaceae bacterium]|nr:Nramp family divalent metal transporter [Flavobacteriaceae bacterium]
MLKKIKQLGPGLLFAGAAIGVSHLVYSTRAGANFGFGLLWALLLINVVKYPFFQFGPRYAAATGESLLEGYNKLGKGVLISYFLLTFATMFTIQTAVTIVTASLASELFGSDLNNFHWCMVITGICLAILVIGRYKLLDNLMKIIILTLTITTVLAVVFATQEVGSVSFTQIFPEETPHIIFLVAFMGWMPAPLDISIWHSLWAVEKRKSGDIEKNTDKKIALFDFNIGYIATIILGAGFVALGALVMYNSGETFSDKGGEFANQLISLYTNTLGDHFSMIIAIAAFTTMFSTTLTTLDASPRAMASTSKLLAPKLVKHTYVFWMLVLIIGTTVILGFFTSEMGTLIKIATILSFLTAPFYAMINYILLTSKHTPEEWRPKMAMKIFSILGILFLIGFSVWYLTIL